MLGGTFIFGGKGYKMIRLQKTNIKDEYRHIYFFNSVLNSAVCRPPLVD